jgi:ubiquinone biosynthesis protein
MDFVRVPRPIPGLVTERVLVMERVPGVRYTDAAEVLDREIDRAGLLRLGIQGVLEHTLVYGVFHGDLHAGNVLVDRNGTFSMVDFGVVGRFDEQQRMALIRFMMAAASENVEAQLQAMVDLGAIPRDIDLDQLLDQFAGHIEEMSQRTSAPSRQDLADGLGQVLRILSANGIRLPKSLVLFFKNLLYLNGFAAALAPDADLMEEFDPVLAYFQTKYAGLLAELSGPETALPG